MNADTVGFVVCVVFIFGLLFGVVMGIAFERVGHSCPKPRPQPSPEKRQPQQTPSNGGPCRSRYVGEYKERPFWSNEWSFLSTVVACQLKSGHRGSHLHHDGRMNVVWRWGTEQEIPD